MVDKNCIFCKIVKGEIPKEFDYEDDEIVAFPDIHPLAPIHLIIIPRKHIADFFHATPADIAAISKGIRHLVDKEKLMGKGYRIVVNGGGAQDINHLHFHLKGPINRGAAM
ncbi:MAG: HIT domain-containing protein [Candidatus Levyibacteriota bacterium]